MAPPHAVPSTRVSRTTEGWAALTLTGERSDPLSSPTSAITRKNRKSIVQPTLFSDSRVRFETAPIVRDGLLCAGHWHCQLASPPLLLWVLIGTCSVAASARRVAWHIDDGGNWCRVDARPTR